MRQGLEQPELFPAAAAAAAVLATGVALKQRRPLGVREGSGE